MDQIPLDMTKRRNGTAPDDPEQSSPPSAMGVLGSDSSETCVPDGEDTPLGKARRLIQPVLEECIHEDTTAMPQRELARLISDLVATVLAKHELGLSLAEQRELVVALVNSLQTRQQLSPQSAAAGARSHRRGFARIEAAKRLVRPVLLERIDPSVAAQLPQKELTSQIGAIISEIITEKKLRLNSQEQQELARTLLDDMLGLGPLEPLLADDTVTDILVNGPNQVYVERHGKLETTDVVFSDDAHIMNVATRIVSRIGRRIDESTPLVDARLEDGSRVNIIAPPLALDGPTISIRKFAKRAFSLDFMAQQGNVSPNLAKLLKIAARCRLNILISGGTGSGKTTLMNSMSQMIDHKERIVTIEDTAELRLQQPHIVRLETRQPNLEGQGEISMHDLLRNSLRMRPDRIIVGEARGAEVLTMLQAMNTGHDGSMCTIHANSPREALTRLENMVAMSRINLSAEAVRSQIADALQLIVQIARMRDGMRRVTRVLEIVGMESGTVTTQDLFLYEYDGETTDGALRGRFVSSGIRPQFTSRAEYYGLADVLAEAVRC